MAYYLAARLRDEFAHEVVVGGVPEGEFGEMHIAPMNDWCRDHCGERGIGWDALWNTMAKKKHFFFKDSMKAIEFKLRFG